MKIIGGTRGPKPSKRVALYNQIKKDIYSEKYEHRLPGVAKLAKIYDSCSTTIQQVLHELADDNYVKICEKSGTYINYDATKNRIAFISFMKNRDYQAFYQEYGNIDSGIQRCFKEANETLDFKLFDLDSISELKEFIADYNRIIVLYPQELRRDITECLNDKFYVRVMGVPNYSNKGGHVTYDNEEVGTLAANYLINQECKRFIHIGTDRLLLFKQRYEAFAASLNYKNLRTESLLIDKENMTPKELYQKLHTFLNENYEDLKNRNLGIFCGADYFLQAIKQELNLLKLKLTDVNIISCDNNPYFLRDIYPMCPTIDINMEDIGYRAATIALLSSDCAIKEAILPTLLQNVNH